MTRTILCLWIVIVVGHATFAAQAESDRSYDVAISIGPRKISYYLIDKYLGRYTDTVRARQHREPSAAEASRWLELFLAKQVVIADAETHGYAERSEVKSVVTRMERQVLTEVSGPYYEELLRADLLAKTELLKKHLRTRSAMDMLIVRFPGEEMKRRLIGGDFGRKSTEEKVARIDRLRGNSYVRIIDGPRVWPYRPFEELADWLAKCAPMGWSTISSPLYGTYVVYVRSVRNEAVDGLSFDDRESTNKIRATETEVLAKRHWYQLLFSAEFRFDDKTAGQVVTFVRRQIIKGGMIPEWSGKMKEATLLRYKVDRQQVSVSAEQFRQYFNGLFIRTPPRDINELRSQAEAMVVSELDYLAATRMGLNKGAKFVEDREGFLGFQVLDLLEKEQLVPNLMIPESSVRRYYVEHQAE